MAAANSAVIDIVVVEVVVAGRGVEKNVKYDVASTVEIVLALGSDKVVYCVAVVMPRTVD